MTGNFFLTTENKERGSLQGIPPSPEQWKSVQALVGKRLSEVTAQLLHERGYRMEYHPGGLLKAVRHVSIDHGSRIIIFDSAPRDYSHLEARLVALNGEAPPIEVALRVFS